MAGAPWASYSSTSWPKKYFKNSEASKRRWQWKGNLAHKVMKTNSFSCIFPLSLSFSGERIFLKAYEKLLQVDAGYRVGVEWGPEGIWIGLCHE